MKKVLVTSIALLFSVTTFCQVQAETKKGKNKLDFETLKDSAILNKLMNGDWEGSGYQFNINESWTIKLIFDKESNKFKIDYPSINCSGYWKATAVTKYKIEFIETISTGKNKCINGGKVVLYLLDETRIEYLFYWPNDRTLDAKGVISRTPDQN